MNLEVNFGLEDEINFLINKVFGDNYFLEKEKVEKIIKYVNFLKDENLKKNLTSRKTTDFEIVNRHILSSLIFVKHIDLLAKTNEINRVVDIGSGAGFPVVICAIFFPKIFFGAIDSIQKKIDFLYDCSKLLDLQNLECFWGRIEDFCDIKNFMNSFDIVTARALGNIVDTQKLSFDLLKNGGTFLTIKSFAQKDEIDRDVKIIKKNCSDISIVEEKIDESYMLGIKK